MKLRAKLTIAGVLPLAAAVLILTGSVVTSRLLELNRAEVAQTTLIAKRASDLNFLADRLLVFREPEIIPVWFRKHNEFQGLLAESRFHGHFQEHLDVMGRTSRDLGLMMVRLANTRASSVSDPHLVAQMEQRLTAAILTTAREIVSEADYLEGEAQEELKAVRGRIEQSIVVLFVAVAALTALAGIPAIIKLSSGFGRLEDGARRLAAGEYDVRIEASGGDEVGRLAGTFNAMASSVQDARKELLVDISMRVQMEEALRKSEQLLQVVLDSVPVGIRLIEASGSITYCNAAARAIWGRCDNAAMVPEGVSIYHHRTEAPVRVSSLGVMRCIALKKTVLGEMIDLVDEAKVRRTVLHGGVPLFSPEGEVTGAIAVDDDVTEQVRLQEELNQSQRIQSIGLLAGGIAHDFNNIMMGIQGFAEVVYDMVDDEEARSMLTAILASSTRAADLTRKLLAFGRRQFLKMETIEVRALLQHVSMFASRVIPEDIAVTTTVAEDAHVTGDMVQLEQVLINLLLNARDALTHGGAIDFSVTRFSLDGQQAVALELEPERVYVCITVSDTGTGIPQEILPKIFEPFFTTKDVGQGTGLGLSMSYGILKQHEGAISVESMPGKTEFRLYLPAVEPKAAVAPIGEETAANGSGHILLVEDDDLVRGYLELVLKKAGYTVSTACNGLEGLDLFGRKRFDAVVTDVIMPDMNGIDMVGSITADHPETRFIFLSGYSEEMLGARGLPLQARVLQKPVAKNLLLREVSALLQPQAATPRVPSL